MKRTHKVGRGLIAGALALGIGFTITPTSPANAALVETNSVVTFDAGSASYNQIGNANRSL
ncbi:MAG: hypothetical protein WCO85_07230 [Actinomycetes bacterium]